MFHKKRNKKILIGVLMGLIILSLCNIGKFTIVEGKAKNKAVTQNDTIISFPDKNLEKVVRNTINKKHGDVYKSDMVKITRIWAENASITNLSGIENCTSLISLNLSFNQISNIDTLKGLIKLNSLNLADNQITNIEDLKGMTSLTSLGLEYNQITNIEDLKEITNLTELYLTGNKIQDYSPTLSYYKKITSKDFTLALPDSYIDITLPDKNLEKAVRDIINKPTEEISLADAKKITTLPAEGKNISNLAGLEKFTNLVTLDLSTNKIRSINALKGLTNLTSLNLCNNEIYNISALKTLTNLNSLYLSGNHIEDYSSTNSFYEKLQGKDFQLNSSDNYENAIILFQDKNLEKSVRENINKPTGDILRSDVDKLKMFSACGKRISNLSGMENFTELTSLNLDFNRIGNIDALKGLTNLTSLSLYNNQINSIEGLKGLANLTSLELSMNNISSIDSLKELTNLNSLDLNKNKINNISALKELAGLKSLGLSSNKISNINDLKGLTNLTQLGLDSNKIKNYTPTKAYYNNLINPDFKLK